MCSLSCASTVKLQTRVLTTDTLQNEVSTFCEFPDNFYPPIDRFWIILSLIAYAIADPDSSTNAPNLQGARQGRDYFPASYEEEKTKFGGYSDYPPSNYITYKEGTIVAWQSKHKVAGVIFLDVPVNCPPSPLVPVLNNGLNFLLLKLGALGLIKSVVAVVFLVLLLKLPIILAKAAFVKAIFFPALLAPLIMLFSGSLGNMMNMMKPNNPNNNQNNNNNNNNDNTGTGSGRGMEDPMGTAAWQSFRLLMDSEKCVERMACQFGVLNNDTTSGAALSRYQISPLICK